MSEDQAIGRGEILALMTEIVSAHLANNAVGQNEVPELIQSVFNKLNELATGEEPASGRAHAGCADQEVGDRRLHRLPRGRQEAEDAQAASDDRLRHDARGVPGKWGLKPDYPMVAPNYAAKRQELAKKIGLGRKPRAR